jgi:DnaK suppressor protein
MKRQEFITKTRGILLKRRAGLLSQLDRDLDQLTIERYPVGDVADRAIDAERDVINAELASADTRELELIEDALRRIEEGLYGECEECHKDIPLARLQALPYAVRCVECQRLVESDRRAARMMEIGGSRWGQAELPPAAASGSASTPRELLVSAQ